MMLRIAVLQISNDTEQEELIKLTQNEAYCRKHGYDYLHKKNTPLIAILSELKNYDWIIHVEYNCLIKDKPFDELLKLNRAIGVNILASAFNMNHPSLSDTEKTDNTDNTDNTYNTYALNCEGLLVKTSLSGQSRQSEQSGQSEEHTTTRRPLMQNT